MAYGGIISSSGVNMAEHTKSTNMYFASLTASGLLVAISCIVAYHLGADINWDLQNYHFYNGYLYTHGKLIADSLGTVQSYLDPFLNSFYYILISRLSPLEVNLVIAALQSLSLVTVYFLAMTFFREAGNINKFTISLIVSLSALFGPVYWSELGGTMGDSLLASPVIMAIILLIRMILKRESREYCYTSSAGLLIGFVSGLKFTNMTYAVATFISLAVCFTVMRLPYRKQFLLLVVFGLSATIAFVVTYGPVGWLLWSTFKNPIFPYFNDIFRSPYLAPYAIFDGRWFPKNILDYLKLPLELCVRQNTTDVNAAHLIGMEIKFRTCLFAAVFVMLPFYMFNIIRRARDSEPRAMVASLFIVSFFVTSFVIWEVMFSYYRYLAVLEIIAPFTLVVMFGSFHGSFYKDGDLSTAMAILVLLLSLYSLPESTWGREPFSSSYFGIHKSTFKEYKNSLLVVGHAPLGFVLPYFPSDNHIIGLPERIGRLRNKFQHSYLKILKTFSGPIYYLTEFNPSLSIARKHSQFLDDVYHLKIEFDTCKQIKTSIYPVAICEMKKSEEDE